MIAGRALSLVSTVLCLHIFCSCQSNTPTSPPSVSVTSDAQLPQLEFFGAYPNPFGATTSLAYEIKSVSADRIECIVYTSSGERIWSYHMPSTDTVDRAAFHSRELPYSVGFSTCTWDGRSIYGQCPNGVYFLELRATKDGHTVAEHTTCMRKR